MRHNYILHLLVCGILLVGLTGCGENKEVAATVNAIDAIGEITINSESAIENAESMYQSLSEDDQQSVTNYDTLVDSRNQYDLLCTEAAIDAIGDVSFESGESIEYAKGLYDALSPELQTQVGNYDLLKTSDETYTFIKVGTESTEGWDYFHFSEEDMTIEKIGEPNAIQDFGNYAALSQAVDNQIDSIFQELNLPDTLLKKVRSTSSQDGTLSEMHDNILVTWSYDPTRDNSLFIQFRYEPPAGT